MSSTVAGKKTDAKTVQGVVVMVDATMGGVTVNNAKVVTDEIRQRRDRYIKPRNARTVSVEHGFDKQPVVLRRDTDVGFTARQRVLDPIPLIVP